MCVKFGHCFLKSVGREDGTSTDKRIARVIADMKIALTCVCLVWHGLVCVFVFDLFVFVFLVLFEFVFVFLVLVFDGKTTRKDENR